MDSEPEVSVTDIDGLIATAQQSLSLLHRSHPFYSAYVQILAMLRSNRYQLSRQKEDLDKSILQFTEAILLLHIRPETKKILNAVQTLFYLSVALLERSKDFEQLDCVKYAMEYLRYLRKFSLDSFDVPRTLVIRALRTQIILGVENGTNGIKEMVVLCNELLSSNKSTLIPAAPFNDLREAADMEFDRGLPTEMLDEVIECLRNAGKAHLPGSYDAWHEVMFALAVMLNNRFFKTHAREDYEEADALLERMLEPGGCPDSFRFLPLTRAALLANQRSIFFKEPEYSEVTISRLRALLRAESKSPSLGEELRLQFTSSLAIRTRDRFREYSLDDSLEEANSHISQIVTASSSSSSAESHFWLEEVRETCSTSNIQQKIEHLENILSIAPPGSERHMECLVHLEKWYESKFHRTNDISDLEEAIKYSRLALDATLVGDPWRFKALVCLQGVLFLAFLTNKNIGYLDDSIAVGYDILESKTPQQTHFHVNRMLVFSLLYRERLLGRIEDVHEAIRLISLFVNNQHAPDSDRFELSCRWAIIARNIGHSTTLTAYKTAMSFLQKSFSFAPTISTQHTRLVAMGENCQMMPLDYASYQIHLGQFEEAVETLEQGRALLWSEMRGLRTLAIQVIKEDSPLAKRFAEINQELETLTISVTPSGRPEAESGVHREKDGTDPFGRLVIKRKKLAEERDALILQFQSQPGLEGFLGAPSFDTLRSAASRGPVIIINHCEWRSDIIIVFHKSLPCSIPTSETFYADANKLQEELVNARKCGLDSKEYQDALSFVLKRLYELVGELVVKRIRMLGVPEQSRIWWCPTSVFCSLPLHAMGPIPSSDGCERYFSDLYIPSYTPSLSALIESRQANPQMPKNPSLLLVAQPDDLLPGVNGEIDVIRRALQARLTVTSLVSGEATPSSVLEGLRASRFAHFACHGVLETGKPFEASFKLHGGSRLTLLDIVRSRLPDAEFAFLSCCHAAGITEDSVADEALHLTAAMQYCGFRSVVGTMWEMADVDGRDLAKTFYKSLFSGKETGAPYYERSAGALRDATQRLREKRGITLERWVNFVHYGA